MKYRGLRGSGIVEFTLLLPLIVGLFLGIWQFGYAFYVYNELEQAVRAGARYSSLLNSLTPGFNDQIKNVVVFGDPAGGATPAVYGLTAANVTVTPTLAPLTGVPTSIRVSITGFQIGTMWPVTLVNKPSTEFPHTGM